MPSWTHKEGNQANTTNSSETETPNEAMLAVELLGLFYFVVVIPTYTLHIVEWEDGVPMHPYDIFF